MKERKNIKIFCKRCRAQRSHKVAAKDIFICNNCGQECRLFRDKKIPSIAKIF